MIRTDVGFTSVSQYLARSLPKQHLNLELISSPLHAVYGVLIALSVYPLFLSILAIPAIQTHAIYLHAIQMIWGQNLLFPEEFGFMRRQATPFWLTTRDGEKLLAWHILPLRLYLEKEDEFRKQPPGVVEDITKTLGIKLLKENPNSKLVVYFHGAGGTLGSGYRPPSYHAIAAASPEDLHIIAIDYRGFGLSSGSPSESGLRTDAVTVVEFALNTLKFPAKQIVLFAQSLGTAVCVATAEHFVNQSPPVLFSGMVLVAPFVNARALSTTYKIAGTIPLLGPIARFPFVMEGLNSIMTSKWPSSDRLRNFIQKVQTLAHGSYRISLLHGKDDWDIPYKHSEILFEHAVNASAGDNSTVYRELSNAETSTSTSDPAGYRLLRESKHGSISLDILEYGLHDKIMGYPTISRAIYRSFE